MTGRSSGAAGRDGTTTSDCLARQARRKLRQIRNRRVNSAAGSNYRPRAAAGRAAAEQMGLQRSETAVIHGHRLGHDLDDSAIALAGHPPVLFAVNPVLNVEMDGPPLGELPALPRIEAAVNVV